jgi:hypothetical protein
MVTFWPAAVVRVKPEADTLLAVPIEPPAAGPDRALAPLLLPLPAAPEAPGKAWPLLVLLVLAAVVALLEVAVTIP